MERNYRKKLERSSDDVNVCMTFALSKADDDNFRCQCDHQHTSLANVDARKWVHEAALLQQGQARVEPTDLPDKIQGGGKLGLPGERRFAPRVGRAGQMKSIEPGACVCARVRVWCV
jgi:hypothetical protein